MAQLKRLGIFCCGPTAWCYPSRQKCTQEKQNFPEGYGMGSAIHGIYTKLARHEKGSRWWDTAEPWCLLLLLLLTMAITMTSVNTGTSTSTVCWEKRSDIRPRSCKVLLILVC